MNQVEFKKASPRGKCHHKVPGSHPGAPPFPCRTFRVNPLGDEIFSPKPGPIGSLQHSSGPVCGEGTGGKLDVGMQDTASGMRGKVPVE